MNFGQKVIVTVGTFVVTIVVICSVFKSDIRFLLTSRSVEREYGKTSENSYFTIDNFYYVDNYERLKFILRKKLLILFIILLIQG